MFLEILNNTTFSQKEHSLTHKSFPLLMYILKYIQIGLKAS